MKKSLLIASLVLCSASAFCAEPIKPLSSTDVASIKTVEFKYTGEEPSGSVKTSVFDKAISSPVEVTASYVDEKTQSQIKITNFLGGGHDVNIDVNWDEGKLSFTPQLVNEIRPASFGGSMSLQKNPIYVCRVAKELVLPPTARLADVQKETVTGTVTESAPAADGTTTLTFTLTNASLANGSGGTYLIYTNPFAITFQATRSATVTTSVNANVAGKAISSKKYYSLAGIESSQPTCGVNIVVTTYADGTRNITKQLYK